MALSNPARRLSPKRNSTQAGEIPELVAEQLAHFGIDPAAEIGAALSRIAARLYETAGDIDSLWHLTMESIGSLPRTDRIALFNAKKFLSFQLAKLLDSLQSPFRRTYQSLGFSQATLSAKGPYAIFDNVSAIFAANPVITRLALVALPAALAVAMAAFGHYSLFTLPPTGGGAGCGGAC